MTEAKTLKNNTVLISGASIAGPALALWLVRYGFAVTLVEKACEVRPGGQAVDFKGITHRTVLERMGILEEVRQARSPSNGDGIIVDARGRKVATVPSDSAVARSRSLGETWLVSFMSTRRRSASTSSKTLLRPSMKTRRALTLPFNGPRRVRSTWSLEPMVFIPT
jgi:hypothetical protein